MKRLLILYLSCQLFSCGPPPKHGWTEQERDDLVSDCLSKLLAHPQAKMICNCILEKEEKKFPENRDYRHLSSMAGDRDEVKECLGK